MNQKIIGYKDTPTKIMIALCGSGFLFFLNYGFWIGFGWTVGTLVLVLGVLTRYLVTITRIMYEITDKGLVLHMPYNKMKTIAKSHIVGIDHFPQLPRRTPLGVSQRDQQLLCISSPERLQAVHLDDGVTLIISPRRRSQDYTNFLLSP